MTNSVKSAFSQPSTGHGGASTVSFDQVSAVPSSAATSFKRPGSVSSSKRSVKSYGNVERAFSMTPRFSVIASPESQSKNFTPGLSGPGTKGFDPSFRSESIGVQHRLPIGEHLVTEMKRKPTVWPEEFKDEPEYDPDEEARRWRRRIEAALRMYPRNNWGPITKWGYLEEIPGIGEFKQREHFRDENGIIDHDKREKERIGKRDIGFIRNWSKYKDATSQWETEEEAQKSLAFAPREDHFAHDAEKLLHAQNNKRLAKIKTADAQGRSINNIREFTRLERREEQYLQKIAEEAQYRKDPGARKIKSGCNYNILAPSYRPGEEMYPVKARKWRACMRALRIQSKQSGARMYNIISWKPHKPCRVPPPKPLPTDDPEEIPEEKLPANRKPSPARPRNILHSLDREEEVPIGATQDNRTNW